MTENKQFNTPSKAELYELYWGQGMSLREIADELHFGDYKSIRRHLEKHGIPIRKQNTRGSYVVRQIPKRHLYTLYWGNELSATEIADRYNTSQEIVAAHIKERKIPFRSQTRHVTSWVFRMRTRESLFDLHWSQRLSLVEIGRKHRVTRNYVRDEFDRKNIPTYNGAGKEWPEDATIPTAYQWPEDDDDEPADTMPDNPDPAKYMVETPLYRDKERLYELYWEYGCCAKHIEAMCDKDPHIHRYLRKQGIPVRQYRTHIHWEPHHGVPPKYEWPDGEPPSEVNDEEDDYQPNVWRDHHTATGD